MMIAYRERLSFFVCRATLSEFGEGYGLTETCAALTSSHEDSVTYGAVGYPVSSVAVKLGEDSVPVPCLTTAVLTGQQ